MWYKTALLLAAVALLSAGPLPAQEVEAPKQAVAIADRMLSMLDQGEYLESYELAAEVGVSSRPLWHSRMKSLRSGLGKAEGRKLLSDEKVSSFADLPSGDYWKLVYETKFSNQPETKEIVVMAQETDGGWAAAAYATDYNRWPEAIRIIYSGLIIVFLIMCLLATITYIVGRIIQSSEKKKAKEAEAKG